MITKDKIHPHNPFLPNALIAPGAPQRPQLNWCHFKPKYAGKLEEDVEAHLLMTNNWMDTQNFHDHLKVQRFCLTLVGEARLRYESLRPINADWEEYNICLGSNTLTLVTLGNNYFTHGRSFHFDKTQKQ